jgi:predicted Zn-dependent protease
LHAAEDPRVEFAFGVLEETRGDGKGAAERFERARKLDPLAAELVERGVARRMQNGDRAGAVALFREFAGARKGELGVQVAYADFLTEQGRGDALAGKLAMEVLEAALALEPGSPAVIRRLCALDRTRAARWIEMLAADDPESVLLFVSVSKSLHDSEDDAANAEVERRYQLALDAHPGHVALARQASEHFRQAKRTDKAIEIIGKHVNAAPWSLDLRVRLGVLCFSAKRNEEGERELKEVLVIDPRRALAHQALAKYYRLRGLADEVVFHASELLKIRGGAPGEYVSLADEFLTMGKAREARLLLEHGVFDHPDDGALRVKLAVASQRDPESKGRSTRLFREAEAAFPSGGIKDPVFLEACAEAMIADGQSKAAEERLRAAIRLFPPDAKVETARVLRRLAGLWDAEGRNSDAAKALRQRADGLDSQ